LAGSFSVKLLSILSSRTSRVHKWRPGAERWSNGQVSALPRHRRSGGSFISETLAEFRLKGLRGWPERPNHTSPGHRPGCCDMKKISSPVGAIHVWAFWVAPTGLGILWSPIIPRALPWAPMEHPDGVPETRAGGHPLLGIGEVSGQQSVGRTNTVRVNRDRIPEAASKLASRRARSSSLPSRDDDRTAPLCVLRWQDVVT